MITTACFLIIMVCIPQKLPWPHSKPSPSHHKAERYLGCGLRHVARTIARHYPRKVRSPFVTDA